MRWLLIFTLLAFSAYQLFLGYQQDRLIYPGAFARLAPATANPPPGAEQIWIEAEPGIRVEGWFWPAQAASVANRLPAVLVTHGNFETIDGGVYHAEKLRELGLSVLMPEYRGYGRSAGRPTQAGILRDLLAWHTWLQQRPEVNPDRLVYFGRSLGGGAAAQLAAQRPPRALILECTFASMDSMALRRLGLPILLRDHWRTDQVVAELESPLLLMHGIHDSVIPVAESRRLKEVARHAQLWEYDGGHTDLGGRNADRYWKEVADFLRTSGLHD